jgi:hypothetical protein
VTRILKSKRANLTNTLDKACGTHPSGAECTPAESPGQLRVQRLGVQCEKHLRGSRILQGLSRGGTEPGKLLLTVTAPPRASAGGAAHEPDARMGALAAPLLRRTRGGPSSWGCAFLSGCAGRVSCAHARLHGLRR